MSYISSLGSFQSFSIKLAKLFNLSIRFSKWINALINISIIINKEYFIDIFIIVVLIVSKGLEFIFKFCFLFGFRMFSCICKDTNSLWQLNLEGKMMNSFKILMYLLRDKFLLINI